MDKTLQKELEMIHKLETGLMKRLPKPCYLYVRAYGRNLEDDVLEIAQQFGKSDGVVFRVKQYEQGDLCWNLENELSKQTTLGKDFEGCVLVILSDEIWERQLHKLLEFFLMREETITPVFEVPDYDYVEEIQPILEQYFYIRVVEGDVYSAEEQLNILEEQWDYFKMSLDDQERLQVLGFLNNYKWKKTDWVSKKLKNIALKLAYENLSDSKKQKTLTAQMVREALPEEKEGPVKRMIGFALEG